MSTGVLAAFDADPAAAEQQQRGRATMAAIVEDVARAGAAFVGRRRLAVPGAACRRSSPTAGAHGAWTVGARAVDARA